MKILALMLCALTLSNCGPRLLIPLDDKVKNEIKSMDVYIEDTQKKMIAEIKQSNISQATGGGLIFGMLDAIIMDVRQQNAEKAMESMHDIVQNLDTDEKVRKHVEVIVPGVSWIHGQKIEKLDNIIKEGKEDEGLIKERMARIKQSNSDAYMTYGFSYRLDPSMRTLQGTLCVTAHPLSKRLLEVSQSNSDSPDPIFRVFASSVYTLQNPASEKEDNVRMWTNNNGAEIKTGVDFILNNVFEQMSAILKKPNLENK